MLGRLDWSDGVRARALGFGRGKELFEMLEKVRARPSCPGDMASGELFEGVRARMFSNGEPADGEPRNGPLRGGDTAVFVLIRGESLLWGNATLGELEETELAGDGDLGLLTRFWSRVGKRAVAADGVKAGFGKLSAAFD